MGKPFPRQIPRPRNTLLELCEARVAQLETRIEQAKTRIEAAETRAEQAETRIESAKTRTEQAEIRAEEAETHVEQAKVLVETLVDTLSETLVGGQAATPPSTVSSVDEGDFQLLSRLTGRQRQVLQQIAKGEHTKQIADSLHISAKTVEYHRMKMMSVLNIHDVPGLVRFAIRVGLISMDG